MFKKFLVISMVLFVVVLVSGCNKKETQVPRQEEKQPVVQENLSQEIEEQVEIKDEAQQQEFILPDTNQENWETYTDDAWGFSIKFPKEFYYKVPGWGEKYPGQECETCGNGGHHLIISDQKENIGNPGIGKDETVHIIISTIKLDTEEALKKREDSLFVYSDILIDGKTALSVESVDKNMIRYSVMKDDYLYTIYAEIIKEDESEEIYNLTKEIFSTFKFIE